MSDTSFRPPPASATNADWSDAELVAAIIAYIQMLRQELAGRPYSKSAVNRHLREGPLSARTKSSIEFRMQNISASLYDLRMPRIAGYLPAKNVGSSVKERIRHVLETLDIEDLRNYVPTADPIQLDEKVSALLRQAPAILPNGAMRPEVLTVNSTRYVRDPAVKAWILSAADGLCEGCGMGAPFAGTDGLPYLEVHHVMPLACHGSDRVSNAVALCPNCHRRCHSSADKDEFKLSLYERIERLKIEVPELDSGGVGSVIVNI